MTPVAARSMILLAVASLASPLGWADVGTMLRSVKSDNDRFEFRVSPGVDRAGRRFAPRGEFSALDDLGRRTEKWDIPLVNRIAPTAGVVHPGGAFVVTFDELDVGGAAHPVVIYDADGRLVRHLTLVDLLRPDDWQAADVSNAAIAWRSAAPARFSDDGRALIITTRANNRIRIHLATGSVLAPGATERAGLAEIPAAGRRLIFGADTALPDLSATDAKDEDSAAAEDAATSSPETPSPETPSPETPSPETPGSADEVEPLRRAAVPPPPALTTPPNYLDWLHETIVRGRATDLYTKAFESFEPFPASSAVVMRAIAGNEEALTSKPVIDWLSRNAAALQQFHAAVEQRGGPFVYERDTFGTLLDMPLPQARRTRDLARAALARSADLTQEGAHAVARQRVVDALLSGVDLGSGVTLRENLAAANTIALADRVLRQHLDQHAAEIEELEQIANQVATRRAQFAPFAALVRSEQAIAFDTLQSLYELSNGRPTLNAAAAKERFPALAGLDALAAEALANQTMDATAEELQVLFDVAASVADEPLPAARSAYAEIEEHIADPASGPLARVLTPAWEQAHFFRRRAEMQLAGLELISRVLAYSVRERTNPTTLAQVTDEIRDPLSGKPFQYRALGDGRWELYSLGRNGLDDGGRAAVGDVSDDIRLWPPE